jgi:hypothetical protein
VEFDGRGFEGWEEDGGGIGPGKGRLAEGASGISSFFFWLGSVCCAKAAPARRLITVNPLAMAATTQLSTGQTMALFRGNGC